MQNRECALLLLFMMVLVAGRAWGYQEEAQSLKNLTPDNYRYLEVRTCVTCKEKNKEIMFRSAGLDLSAGEAALDKRGWLASAHARSQSHGDRVNTACAWCHAPTAEGAVQNNEDAKPIPKGTWEGVSCLSCHPGKVARAERESLAANLTPGKELTDPASYTFRKRTDGKEMNSQCRFCHHESHELLSEAKQEMMNAGDLRCIDCHMASYAVREGTVERFHNFKVAQNLPHSCSGGAGGDSPCHDGADRDGLEAKIAKIKGPRKEW